MALLLHIVHHQQVTEQGLWPDMALRVCNSPQITKSTLSHEITKLVIVHPDDKVSRILQTQKADAFDTAGGLVSFAKGNGGTGETGEGCQAGGNVITGAPSLRF